MRTTSVLLQLALATTAAAQILPPTWGVVQRSGHRAVEIQGLPGSWLAVPALDGPVDAVASSSRQVCWTRSGMLNIRERQTGATRRIPVPEGPALLAFDPHGALAALWSVAAGELYTADADWAPVLSLPPGASEVLDLSNPEPGSILLLLRTGGGRCAAAEAASNRPVSRIGLPVRADVRSDLERLAINSLTGRVISRSPLADRTGPAALDSAGEAVFASESGLPSVDSIQHLGSGWFALTTATQQYAWRRGMRPQATTDTTNQLLQVRDCSSGVCRPLDAGSTLFQKSVPVGVSAQDLDDFELFNTSTGSLCVLSDKGFCPNPGPDGSCADPDLSNTFIDHSIPVGTDSRGNPLTANLMPIPGSILSGMAAALPIQFTPYAQITYIQTLTIEYYVAGGAPCQSTLPSGVTPLYLQIPFAGTGSAPLPGPQLMSISPTANMVGAPAFTLTLLGAGFQTDSQVLWNGANLTVTSTSATQLTATVPANLLTIQGAATIKVNNPTTNSGVSQGVVFKILIPPPPQLQPTLVLDQTQPVSNSQVKVSVKFDQNAPSGGVSGGLLTLSFTPAANLADDPSIFLDGNLMETRAQPFTVPAGSNVAMFGSQNFVMMNTGTTAGTFTLKAALGDKSAQWGPYVIGVAAPVITSSSLGLAAGGMQLILQGFDTSQTTSGLTFEFYTKDESVVSPGLITMDSASLTQRFSQYYQANSLLAGKFQVTASFPVTGNVKAISKANVTLSNPSGAATVTVLAQ